MATPLKNISFPLFITTLIGTGVVEVITAAKSSKH